MTGYNAVYFKGDKSTLKQTEEQSGMDNAEKLTTLGTQDKTRRQTKQKPMSNTDPTKNRG